MIPRRYAPVLFAFLLSGLMSLLVSGVTTYRTVAGSTGVIALWSSAWMTAWLIAFPAVLVTAPLVRRVVDRLTVAKSNSEPKAEA